MTWTMQIGETASEIDARRVAEGLSAHAEQQGIEPRNYRPLSIVLHEGDGVPAGGLLGATVWGWLHVTEMWIAETHRGNGHGARVMRAAEDEAQRRGCHHAVLDTFDFQARGFYEKLGYEVFGSLTDFPTGHTRFFMKKRLV